MYASIWLWGIAQGMLLENWLAGWATLPAFAAMYFIRTPREEQLMIETFGDAYRYYAQRTGRVIPPLTRSAERSPPPETAAGPDSNGESSPPAG